MITTNGFSGNGDGGAPQGPANSRMQGFPVSKPAALKLVSLEKVLADIRTDLFTGTPPVEYAVADKEWGTLALRPGDVMGIAAPPGMGKTALVGQITVDALRLHPNARCLIVNVEMTPQVLLERQLARLSGVPYEEISGRRNLMGRQHLLNPALNTLEAIGDRMVFMGPRFSIENVIAAVQGIKPDIVVLDYLQRIECCDGVSDTRTRLNTLMHEVRILASAGVSVVLVSAVARTQSKKGGGYNPSEIGMGSFRESSEVEYGCDDAFVLVEEAGSETVAGRKTLNLRHVKSRNHRQHDLRLEFDGAVQRFRLLPDKKEDPAFGAGGGIVPPPSGTKSARRNPIDPWSLQFPGEEAEGS